MSIIGDILGTGSAARGQRQAASAAQRAADASLAEQQRQYNQSRADFAPYLQTGTAALGTYANLLGQNGQAAQQTAMGQFTASPDYNFRLNEGARALTARNSMLGIQDSGAAQKSAIQYSQGLASQEYGNWANRLAALAGVGQTTAQNQAQLGSNYANQVTGINQNLSGALGSSYINRGNIWGNLINNWSGQAQQAGSIFMGGR